jgi:hypothetical protein
MNLAQLFRFLSFVALLLVMFALWCLALRRTTSFKVWFSLFLVLNLVFSVAARSGLVAQNFNLMAPLLFASMFIFGIAFSFSKSGGELARALPITLLIGVQGFRLPLEVILHQWSLLGLVPGTMTWTGQNFDIVSGITSLVSIPFLKNNLKLALAVNSIGFVLLLNVVRVVVMSSPLPFAWQLDNPVMLVAYFPYCLIAPLCVMSALVGHLISFRAIVLGLKTF